MDCGHHMAEEAPGTLAAALGGVRWGGSGDAARRSQSRPTSDLASRRGGDRAVEVGQRPADDLDALVLVGLRRTVVVGQAGGVEDVHDLVEHADAGGEARDRLPASSARSADLLGQLAARRVQRRLALLVEAARRDLQEVGVADRLARLADEPDVLVVVGDGRRRALVVDDLALDLVAVGVAEALDARSMIRPS